MNNRTLLVFGLFSTSAICGAIACTTTVVDTTPTPDDGGADGAVKPKPDGGGGGADQEAPPPTGDQACAAEATRAKCGTCCLTNHKSGATLELQVVTACACKGTGQDGGTVKPDAGPCSTECKDELCANPQKAPTTACNACLDTNANPG